MNALEILSVGKWSRGERVTHVSVAPFGTMASQVGVYLGWRWNDSVRRDAADWRRLLDAGSRDPAAVTG